MASPAPNDDIKSPAEKLTGVQMGDWIVDRQVTKSPKGTGGCFSVTYSAHHARSGQRGFLKVADLVKSMGNPEKLRQELNNFEYEARVLELCKSLRMDGVVIALDTGVHKVTLEGLGLEVAIPYLVFEEAAGDLRTHKDADYFDLSWRLRVFHGVCVALKQLHQAEIAHQDLKPSNVLVFENNKAKIADLGRATQKGNPSSFDGFPHQGDHNYIPIELMYEGYHTPDWARRRLGADFFMLGCLLVYLFADASLLTLMFARLDKRFWPQNGKHQLSAVLPHLEMAFDQAILDLKSALPPAIAEEVLLMVATLAHPNPDRRGRPYLHGDKWQEVRDANPDQYMREQYSLESMISRADVMATRAKKGAHLNKTPFMDFIRKP